MRSMTIRDTNRRPWRVVMLHRGDRYGRDDCLVHHGDEPLVEFWDLANAGETMPDEGQFVSRYYLSTMLEHEEGLGLCLQGDVPAWTLSAPVTDLIIAWLALQPVEPPGKVSSAP